LRESPLPRAAGIDVLVVLVGARARRRPRLVLLEPCPYFRAIGGLFGRVVQVHVLSLDFELSESGFTQSSELRNAPVHLSRVMKNGDIPHKMHHAPENSEACAGGYR